LLLLLLLLYLLLVMLLGCHPLRRLLLLVGRGRGGLLLCWVGLIGVLDWVDRSIRLGLDWIGACMQQHR
jgi:hypothetical protein